MSANKNTPRGEPTPTNTPNTASEPSTLERQLTHFFSTYLRTQGVSEDKLESLLFTRLVQARVRMLTRHSGEWGGGGGYTDIEQIPKARLERLAEEIVESMWEARVEEEEKLSG